MLSFGTGNLNDEMLEAISRDGNGNYYCIDGIREARKVFLQKLSGTLVIIAKDVKLQLEFNPARSRVLYEWCDLQEVTRIGIST